MSSQRSATGNFHPYVFAAEEIKFLRASCSDQVIAQRLAGQVITILAGVTLCRTEELLLGCDVLVGFGFRVFLGGLHLEAVATFDKPPISLELGGEAAKHSSTELSRVLRSPFGRAPLDRGVPTPFRSRALATAAIARTGQRMAYLCRIGHESRRLLDW